MRSVKKEIEMAKTIKKTETKAKRKSKPPTYTYKLEETLIYRGKLYEEYFNKECVVKDRGKKHKHEFYKVEFSPDFKIEVMVEVLKRKEEMDESKTT